MSPLCNIWTGRAQGWEAPSLPQEPITPEGCQLGIYRPAQNGAEATVPPPLAPWSSAPGAWGLALTRVSPPRGTLQADAHTQFPEQGRFLQLQALSKADGGDYRCTAHNAAGSTSVAFHVEIHSEWASPRPTLALLRAAGSPHPLPLCPSPSGAHHPARTSRSECLREPDGPAALPGGRRPPSPRELEEGRSPPGS